MKSFFKEKKITHKIIIAIIIVTLFNFMSPTISQAGIGGILFEPIKDLLLVIADGIMSLTQQFIFDLDVSFLTIYHKDSGWKTAAQIGGALLGLIVSIAIPGVGLVAGALITAGTSYIAGQIAENSIPPTFKLPMFVLTPENMFNNSIGFLDVNFFEDSDAKGAKQMDIDGDGSMDGYYIETVLPTGEVMYQKSSALVLRPVISSWYYAIRNFAIIALLSILLYTAIRIIISSTAEDKAKYKQKLMDWLVAMCLLFFMHYIMAIAVSVTEAVTEAVNSFNQPYIIEIGTSGGKLNEYKYGTGTDESSEGESIFGDSEFAQGLRSAGIITGESGGEKFMWPTNLMGKARMELQLEPTDITEDDVEMRQFGYTVIYLVLVIYTMLFLFRYVRRLLMLTFLTIIAPLMAMTYPLDKMKDGSAQGYGTWLKEYLFNLLIQPVHLILYTLLIGSAMDLVQDNFIYAIVALGFLLEAEKLLRKFFGFDRASTVESGSALGGALAMQGLNSVTKLLSKGGKSEKSSGGSKAINTNASRTLSRGKDKGKDINDLYASGADALEAGSGAPSGEAPSGRAPSEESQEENKTPLQRMADAYDEKYGTDEWDPQEREALMREAYGNQPSGMEYSADEYAQLLRDIGYEENEIQDMMADDPRFSTPALDQPEPAPTLSEGTARTAESNDSEPRKLTLANRAGRAVRYYAPKAGKGIGKFAAQTLPKAALKATLAGTGAMIGLSAGLASDDFGNVAKWGAAGAAGGWVAGKGAETFVENKTSGLEKLPEEFYNVTHTEDEIKARRNNELDKAWAKDRDVVNKYAEQFGCTRKVARENYMKQAQKFREYGVTDDDVIIKAMKAQGEEFGAEKTASEQRILLAQLAGQVNNSKDADQVEARLQKRRFSKDRAKQYADKIREMKGLV